MTSRFLTLAGLPVLGMLFASISTFPAVAGSPRTFAARPAGPAITRQAGPARFDRRSHTALCSGDANPSFVGVATTNNSSAGFYSAVLGGDYNDACDDDDAVGGGTNNNIGNSGNAPSSFIGAGDSNLVNSSFAFVGAGESNNAAGTMSFVGAGTANSVTGSGSFLGSGGYTYIVESGNAGATANSVSGTDSFLGSGDLNSIEGSNSFVGSGIENDIQGMYDAIGGGADNTALGSASYATIGGGGANAVGMNFATIAGGQSNRALGEWASALGGYSNNAKGKYATVAGGYGNTAAGELSFAAGYHADATYPGSFVWSDYNGGSALLKDTAANQFIVRAAGGIYIYSSDPASAGVALTPGSGAWASLSDRNAKTDIAPLDDASILAKVATLPIESWQYKSEKGVRHVGPMAQDFYAAFGTGVDNRHITSIDEDGVALAAIKALHSQVAALQAQNAALSKRLDAIAASVRK